MIRRAMADNGYDPLPTDTTSPLGDDAHQALFGMGPSAMAKLWNLPLLAARRVKGHFGIDWADEDTRAKVTTELATAAGPRSRASMGRLRWYHRHNAARLSICVI